MREERPSGGEHRPPSQLGLSSEERLARRAAQGDERAFAAIFRRYGQPLYRYCLAIAGNPADAQDALQNTMVKALRALPGERREVRLRPWLYRVAHNEAVEILRRRREAEVLDPEAAAPGAELSETVERRQRLRGLLADLEQLPERQRGALVMRELAGLEFEEIGGALGTSGAVARQTVYEARLSLRQMEAGREMSCDAVTHALSDADGRTLRRRDVRAHLRACSECRAFRAEIDDRRGNLAALSPLPAAAAAALLKGALGSAAAGGSASAAGISGAAGAGVAGNSAGAAAGSGVGAGALGATGVTKAVATLTVAAVLGLGAERAGIVHVGGDSGATPASGSARDVAEPHDTSATPTVASGHRAAFAIRRARVASAIRGKAGPASHIVSSSAPAGSATDRQAQGHRADHGVAQAEAGGAIGGGAANGKALGAGHGKTTAPGQNRAPGEGAGKGKGAERGNGQSPAHGHGPAGNPGRGHGNGNQAGKKANPGQGHGAPNAPAASGQSPPSPPGQESPGHEKQKQAEEGTTTAPQVTNPEAGAGGHAAGSP